MLTSALLALALGAAPAADKDSPARKELFGGEGWYKERKEKEQEFVGVLQKAEGGGRIGFGRFNPYRLEMKGDVREVYVGGKPQILADYVGKRVRLIGKPIDIGVEGKRHREIWPARLVLAAAPDKVDDKTKEPKVLARGAWSGPADPEAGARQRVIRNAVQAARAMQLAPDGKGQKQATDTLARALRFEKLDWDRHVVIMVTAGAKPTGGYSVEITKLEPRGDTLVVHWKLKSPAPGDIVTQAFTHPGQVVLLEALKKEVKFNPALKTDKDRREK